MPRDAAFSVPGGGYCYFGPHPVDTRVSAGEPWDDTPGAHMHAYPPLDLRLFELRDGCYYFVGDPRDFGYAGPTYSYYGAHPILDEYGGGWCFMIGPHTHLWRPWSPNFALVGPWYYWEGPYDPFFWAYWPYYSFYYRSYYPRYYVGGRFTIRGLRHGAAHPTRATALAWSVGAAAAGSPGWRGSSVARPNWRSRAPVVPYRSATPAGRRVSTCSRGRRGRPVSTCSAGCPGRRISACSARQRAPLAAVRAAAAVGGRLAFPPQRAQSPQSRIGQKEGCGYLSESFLWLQCSL